MPFNTPRVASAGTTRPVKLSETGRDGVYTAGTQMIDREDYSTTSTKPKRKK